jgi:hypothetical protein
VVNDKLGRFEATANGTHKVTDAEPSNPIGVTTNGTHRVTDAEPSNPIDDSPQSLNASSMDERLDALLQMIRTWDWRTAPAATGPPPAEVAASTVAASTASPLTTPASAQVREDSEPHTRGASPAQSIADTQPVMLVGTPRHAKFEPAPADPDDAPELVTSSSEPEHEPDHFLARLWSNHRFKEAVFGLAAVVLVLLLIAGIRLIANGNTGSSDPYPTTTVTQPAPPPAHHIHFVAPISAAELAQYEGYADGLQQANTVATKALVSAGKTPAPTQLSPVITTYGSALNLYDFQLHFIQWPTSMQTTIAVDHAQMKTFMSFLQTFSIVSPTGMAAWLSQFHDRAGTAQTADNQVRRDLGLPSSSSFPS